MAVRGYLRASGEDENADGAREELDTFAEAHGVEIASYYVERVSGASLKRPKLFRLLKDCRAGDVLLVEAVDRLVHLTSGDWNKLRAEIDGRQVRVVSLDLPTSWGQLSAIPDNSTDRMFDGMNSMMLDVLAVVARKEYEASRRRRAQGMAKAKAEGRYKGRPENVKRNAEIAGMLCRGFSWSEIQSATGCSRPTINRIAKRLRERPFGC